MNVLLVFVWVYGAMIALALFESHVEGRNAWDKGKLGWKLRINRRYVFPAYHFFGFLVMVPLFLSLPLAVYGWDTKLFGILLSAYFSGLVVEDFAWFMVNPATKISDFNPKFANYYPWVRVGLISVPALYIAGIALALASWFFIWR
ncbi:hypothetical protein HY640_02170 [Candidatus Woesearchaeota archaeon]|nr:hypothetical protein [Candidatus Woesearchaeota archaeon]